MKPSIKIIFDKNKLKARMSTGISKAQFWLDIQVEKDTQQYVPMISGTLFQSANKPSYAGKGKVVYHTPYARAQYYGKPNKSTSRHPWATMKWAEASKRVNMSMWARGVKVAFGQGAG
jgi:hypothetical protein